MKKSIIYTVRANNDTDGTTQYFESYIQAVRKAIALFKRLGMWSAIIRPDGTEALHINKWGEPSTSPARRTFRGVK